MITSTEAVWFSSGLVISRMMHASGIAVLRTAPFEPGLFEVGTLKEIKRAGYRVLILLAFDDDMNRVATIAAEQLITARGWAWILLEPVVGQAMSTMLGWLTVQPLLPSEGMQDFAKQVSNYTKSHFNLTISPASVDLTYSAALHDAILLYAHAATKVLSVGGDPYDGKAVTAAIRSTAFQGMGGSAVALDEQGDRLASYEVTNYVVGADGTIRSVRVGVYDIVQGRYEAYERKVVWPGNTVEVPADYFSGECTSNSRDWPPAF